MTGGATEIHQPPFGEQENFVTIGERVLVHLRFDIGFFHAFGGVERIDLNLVIEMADVGHDCLIFHPPHVFKPDHVEIATGSDIDVAAAERVFDRGDFVAFHRCLQRIDRVNLRDTIRAPWPRNDCAQPLPTSP